MKKNQEIHIVAFNIPYPPNYGGIIDVFYKIKALFNAGISINLHCFKYDRPESLELEKYCKSVHYYDRPKRVIHNFSVLPFIVKTRSNSKLIDCLNQDQHPILFEGLHTTFHLPSLLKNKKRKIIIRTHNIEHQYYYELARKENILFKKIFFYIEAIKLRTYEKILKSDITIAAISKNDCTYFKTINSNSFLIPAFHSNNKINILPGKGKYILYHGDLSVNENIEAAEFIIKNICPKVDFPFIFAGRNPDLNLKNLISKSNHTELISNPTLNKMDDLIQNAHIHLLLTSQSTGIKLKLINTLYAGRHCIANKKMIEGTDLESLVYIKNKAQEIIDQIEVLLNSPFTGNEIDRRNEILLKIVNNHQSAEKLINLLN